MFTPWTKQQARKASRNLNLEPAPLPAPIAALRSRKERTGVILAFSGPTYYQLVRNDSKCASTYQRSPLAFARKYHINRIYHYSGLGPHTARLEVQFSK